MSVVWLSLVQSNNEETVQVLTSLWGEARRDDDPVTDVCVSYRRRSGLTDFAFSGVYRRDPAKALMAAMRLSMQLTTIEEEVRGRP